MAYFDDFSKFCSAFLLLLIIMGFFTNDFRCYVNIPIITSNWRKILCKKTSHRNMPCNFATESIISTAYLPFLLTVYHFTSAISWWRCFWLAGSPVSLACLKACQVLSELRLSQETQNCWSSRTFEALTIYLPTSITT